MKTSLETRETKFHDDLSLMRELRDMTGEPLSMQSPSISSQSLIQSLDMSAYDFFNAMGDQFINFTSPLISATKSLPTSPRDIQESSIQERTPSVDIEKLQSLKQHLDVSSSTFLFVSVYLIFSLTEQHHDTGSRGTQKGQFQLATQSVFSR